MDAWRLVSVVLLAAPLLAADIAAHAQNEPLTIDSDGSVKIGTARSNVWLNGKIGVGGGKGKPAHSLDVNGTVSANSFVGMGAVPVGAILMWSGKPDQLPAGWAFCDGRNVGTLQTPDLRGRFIVGYDERDTDYNASGKTGGAATVTLTEQQMPAHVHTGLTDKTPIPVQKGIGNLASLTGTTAGAGLPHAHHFTTNPAGGGQPHENRPPFYVLAYIMYTGK